MIFAPRSCPSSPGLATTTRIFFSEVLMGGAPASVRNARVKRRPGKTHALLRWPSEGGGFAVGAEHGLQRLDHLALGRLGARGVEQQRHQVRPLVASAILERVQSRVDGRVVTGGADRSEPLD